MQKRFISIWFRHLKTDWHVRRQPALSKQAFVLVSPSHGRMLVTATNTRAENEGIFPGMVLADARALLPSLYTIDDKEELAENLLCRIAAWCIRYTPSAAIDPPDGLLLDITGCAHIWGDEKKYLEHISNRLKNFGYDIRLGLADTIGAAWAVARFDPINNSIAIGKQATALLNLPAAALRLDSDTIERLNKLGLRQISQFINIPPTALRRRFGTNLLQRLNQALGNEDENILPIHPVEPYQERLSCLEPIATYIGIKIALEQLLDTLCKRLQQEQKGVRNIFFECYRVDGKMEFINIGTNRPSCNNKHLFKLLEERIATIEPALGIELFILKAPIVEDLLTAQESLWKLNAFNNIELAELLDRLAGKIGEQNIHRYLPVQHYWPERSYREAVSLDETTATNWKINTPRPLQLLKQPEKIEVSAPIPDYPPMNFRYNGKLHKIIRADGPERIEPEWWLQEEAHRDYYRVEDENGNRYWLFRAGHYDPEKFNQWFIHGFFA